MDRPDTPGMVISRTINDLNYGPLVNPRPHEYAKAILDALSIAGYAVLEADGG